MKYNICNRSFLHLLWLLITVLVLSCRSKKFTEDTFFSQKKVNKKGITKEYANSKKPPSVVIAEEYQDNIATDPKKAAKELNKEMERRKRKADKKREKYNKKIERKRKLKKYRKKGKTQPEPEAEQ